MSFRAGDADQTADQPTDQTAGHSPGPKHARPEGDQRGPELIRPELVARAALSGARAAPTVGSKSRTDRRRGWATVVAAPVVAVAAVVIIGVVGNTGGSRPGGGQGDSPHSAGGSEDAVSTTPVLPGATRIEVRGTQRTAGPAGTSTTSFDPNQLDISFTLPTGSRLAISTPAGRTTRSATHPRTTSPRTTSPRTPSPRITNPGRTRPVQPTAGGSGRPTSPRTSAGP